MCEKFEGFVYIKIDNPMAAWNVVRSAFYSPSCLPQSERAGALSFGMADLLKNENVARAMAEFQLDEFRRKHFPDTVSRLSGIFLFDDVCSAVKVCNNDEWSGHFNSEYLTDVGVVANRSSRVDATWITLMRNEENILVDGWEVMAESYWSGMPANNEPIWERIIDGYVTVWGGDLKNRALSEVQKFWPQSLPLLAIAANSAILGSCDGAIIPYATWNGGNIEIRYYLRMVDALDIEFCKRLKHFLETDDGMVCRLGPVNNPLILPDFSCYNFERRIGGNSFIW